MINVTDKVVYIALMERDKLRLQPDRCVAMLNEAGKFIPTSQCDSTTLYLPHPKHSTKASTDLFNKVMELSSAIGKVPFEELKEFGITDQDQLVVVATNKAIFKNLIEVSVLRRDKYERGMEELTKLFEKQHGIPFTGHM